MHHIKCVNNNARFCYQRKQKLLFTSTSPEECKYEKNNKMENLINDDSDPNPSDESNNELDDGSDDVKSEKSESNQLLEISSC